MRRLLAILLVLGCGGVDAVEAAPPGVRIYQSTTDRSITEGETVIPGDPAEIYARVLDYARWVDIFPNVAKVVITSQKGDDARVTLVKPDGNKDNLHFHNQPAARMLWFEDTGNGGRAEVWAEIVFIPGTEPKTTRVHARLYAEVHGIASLVVGNGDVRKMREIKIESDLVAIRGYFQRLASSQANGSDRAASP
jgi:hypothetical protein